ncbi:MAG: hypothetical protein JWP36_1918 [Paucimonas sp.]|nr:hypothetical protein [Paucimonas sp.]
MDSPGPYSPGTASRLIKPVSDADITGKTMAGALAQSPHGLNLATPEKKADRMVSSLATGAGAGTQAPPLPEQASVPRLVVLASTAPVPPVARPGEDEQNALGLRLAEAAGGVLTHDCPPIPVNAPAALQELFKANAFIPVVLPGNPACSALAQGLPGWLGQLDVRHMRISERAPAGAVSPGLLAQRLRLMNALLDALKRHPQAGGIGVSVDVRLVFQTGRPEAEKACGQALQAWCDSFENDTLVTSLRVTGFHLHIAPLLEALLANHHLTRLELPGNVLDPYAAGLLCRLIEKTAHLTRLDLGQVTLFPSLVGSLVQALEKNDTLEYINLKGIELPASEQATLDALMRRRPGLQVEYQRPAS